MPWRPLCRNDARSIPGLRRLVEPLQAVLVDIVQFVEEDILDEPGDLVEIVFRDLVELSTLPSV
jgi:hypothetical protein